MCVDTDLVFVYGRQLHLLAGLLIFLRLLLMVLLVLLQRQIPTDAKTVAIQRPLQIDTQTTVIRLIDYRVHRPC